MSGAVTAALRAAGAMRGSVHARNRFIETYARARMRELTWPELKALLSALERPAPNGTRMYSKEAVERRLLGAWLRKPAETSFKESRRFGAAF